MLYIVLLLTVILIMMLVLWVQELKRRRAISKDLARAQEQRDQWQAMAEGSDQTLVLIGPAQRILAITSNIQLLTGLPASTLIGQAYPDAFSPVEPIAKPNTVPSQNSDLTDDSCIIQLKQPSGNTISVVATIHEVTIPLSESGMHYQVVRLRDVSLTQGRSAQRANFLSAIAHELRTPLAVIRGYSEILMRPELLTVGGEDSAFYAAGIYDETHHLASLIETLLDISRLETSRLTLTNDFVDLVEVIDEVSKHLAESNRIQRKLSASIPLVWGDERRLRQVFLQLLTFALNRAPANSTVVLNIEPVFDSRSSLRIDIHDSGESLSSEQQAELFEQYYQLAGSGRNTPGPGLALCRAIVEAHGGHLTMKCQPGEGCMFTIDLPLQLHSSTSSSFV